MENQTNWEMFQDVQQQWLLHKDSVRVQNSEISGYGLVPKTTLNRGDFSLEYVGEWEKLKSDHNRGHQLQHTLDGKVHYFITPLGSDDEDQQRRIESLPPAAYVNHPKAGEPANLIWNVADAVPFMELAVECVEAGVELTIDYGEDYWTTGTRRCVRQTVVYIVLLRSGECDSAAHYRIPSCTITRGLERHKSAPAITWLQSQLSI
jgi:hypothetical protein